MISPDGIFNLLRFNFLIKDILSKSNADVRNSIFGGLWTFESDNKKADSEYSQEELRPHTDSTYSNDAPGLQLLLCCKYNAKG